MPINVGLMGLGRIGRNVFRILHDRDDVQVTAISDIADHKSLEYLLRYDTILGRFPTAISLKEGHLYSRGRQIKMLDGRSPGDVNWNAYDVDVVIEATGRGQTKAEARKHLDSGAKRVILCAPPLDEPDATIVMGVNHDTLGPQHKIISNASVTAHCVLPIIKILDRAFGIDRLFFTSVHAYANDQRLADVPADELRRSRAASENIIPTTTNTPRIIEQILPQLEGRTNGMAMSVPIANGSLVDMVCFMQKDVSKTAVNEVVQTGVDADYKHYVEYVTDPIVSNDVIRSPYSSLFDSDATLVMGERIVKTITWSDIGWGYAHRVVDMIDYLAGSEGGL